MSGFVMTSHVINLLKISKFMAIFIQIKVRIIYVAYLIVSRSQWPRGLRRRSSAARLLRLWVRIPPGAWMFVVSVVCCQVEVSATD